MPAEEEPLIEEMDITPIPKNAKRITAVSKGKLIHTEEQQNNYIPPKTEFLVEINGKIYLLKVIRPIMFENTTPIYKTMITGKGIRRIYVRYYSRRRQKWKWVLIRTLTPIPPREAKRLSGIRQYKASKLLRKAQMATELNNTFHLES